MANFEKNRHKTGKCLEILRRGMGGGATITATNSLYQVLECNYVKAKKV